MIDEARWYRCGACEETRVQWDGATDEEENALPPAEWLFLHWTGRQDNPAFAPTLALREKARVEVASEVQDAAQVEALLDQNVALPPEHEAVEDSAALCPACAAKFRTLLEG